ncbi:cytochrome bd-I oxidase subunit CydX [Stenotrophomonas sp. B1-1]|nr:cytochrome bd-I oxidase subunit CydX [Stenotrophomonas sp. B1-1]
MWYFAWILGTGLASTVAILNGMWFESREENRLEQENRR